MIAEIDQAEIEQKQKLLEQHRRNLDYLQQQAALYGVDVPLAIHNGLTAEQDAISVIERELATLGVSPQPEPSWQALIIDTDSHWREIIAKNIDQLGGMVVERQAVPRHRSAKSIKNSAVAIVGIPDLITEEASTRQWIKDVVKLGHSLPIILLACWHCRDTAIALRQAICDGQKDVMAVTVFKENFDPGWFSRVVHKILIQ
jgi:hypothetical protein